MLIEVIGSAVKLDSSSLWLRWWLELRFSRERTFQGRVRLGWQYGCVASVLWRCGACTRRWLALTEQGHSHLHPATTAGTRIAAREKTTDRSVYSVPLFSYSAFRQGDTLWAVSP